MFDTYVVSTYTKEEVCVLPTLSTINSYKQRLFQKLHQGLTEYQRWQYCKEKKLHERSK